MKNSKPQTVFVVSYMARYTGDKRIYNRSLTIYDVESYNHAHDFINDYLKQKPGLDEHAITGIRQTVIGGHPNGVHVV